jgi:drug/metabolite transporter (DMT)-like permease
MRRRTLSRETIGGALIAFASLQFGSVVVLGKITERHLPVPSMLAVRFAFASLLLLAALLVRREPVLPARGERVRLAVLGALFYAPEAMMFFLGAKHGTAAAVTLLFFTYPVIVAFAWWAIGRGAPGWLLGSSLVFATTGAAIVVAASGRFAISGLGVTFALSASVWFTAYLILADLVLKRTPPLAGAMWVSAWASAFLVVFALVTGEAEDPGPVEQWVRLLGMGAATAGAFVCLFAGLRRIGPVRTAIVAAAEPLATTILAAVFLSEPIRGPVALGGALILIGAVTASVARLRGPERAEPPVP